MPNYLCQENNSKKVQQPDINDPGRRLFSIMAQQLNGFNHLWKTK
jgi:hypothetical protein